MAYFRIQKAPEVIGICPICNRQMIVGVSSDVHHLIPRAKGGTKGPTIKLHRVCHNKIHSIWSEGQLAKVFNTVEKIVEFPEMQTFIAWVRKKPVDFYISTKMANARKR